MAALEIVRTDPKFRIAYLRNVQVNVLRDAPTVEQMRAFARSGSTLGRRHERGAGLLNVVTGDGTPSFSEEVRHETVQLMKTPGMFTLGSAHIILFDGFKGTAVRAFMSTVMLLGRPPSPNKVFGDAEAAAAWLAPLLAKGAEAWSPAELVALVKRALAQG